MVFTRKHKVVLPAKDLYIGNIQTLAKNHHHKYLGTDLSSELSWTHPVQLICKKVKKLAGIRHRNFSTFANTTVMLRLYKSLIQPHLEYPCIAWDPHLQKDMRS